MSERYPGGVISRTPPTVSKNPPSAPGVWTLEQQAAYQRAGTWPYGGPFNYIEDVFSTYLYTGNGSTQTITNGIDLSTNGGLIWSQIRSGTIGANNGALVDTVRGINSSLVSNSTSGATGGLAYSDTTSFNTNGFSLGYVTALQNRSGNSMASWTFRKQPKFFDVVTYTGTGSSLTVNHNLGSTPGCIIIKNYNPGNTDWTVYHRSLGTGAYLQLNNANASVGSSAVSAVSSTTFTVAGGSANWNSSGQSYVAYLFAHDAGGFGLTGADNVISCGSFTTNGSGTASVTLGYEPQWLLVKRTDSATGGVWRIIDNMRGFGAAIDSDSILEPNTSNAETTGQNIANPTATGFDVATISASATYIYIAIRRGPMKTPTSGTSVFSANTSSAATGTLLTTNFPVDMQISTARAINVGTQGPTLATRLARVSTNTTSVIRGLVTSTADAESTTNAFDTLNWGNTGFAMSSSLGGASSIYWNFERAPGFMDVVCYTGTGSATTQAHNLNAVPELMIVKNRTSTGGYDWFVYHSALGNTRVIVLNTSAAAVTISSAWNNTTPTSTVFSVGTAANTNRSGDGLIAYLFASCPGVSKVGSYSGTGGTQTISCGFAARFVMIKRTDSTGDWWVWDTARGMVAGNDNRQALNTGLAQTNQNWVYTDASGFQIVTTDISVNASGGTYIYLAIA